MTQSENGPHCVHIPNGIMTIGGDPMTLTAYGKTYRFEWHRFCGPMFCKKNGDELKKSPGERNKWWKGFDLWVRQGQRTRDGVCVWDAGSPCGSCLGKGCVDGAGALTGLLTPCRNCHGEGVVYPVETKLYQESLNSPNAIIITAPAG